MFPYHLAQFILIPSCLGALVIYALYNKQNISLNILERITLSFPLGLGLICIMMYLLDLAKIPVTFPNTMLIITILFLVILIALLRLNTPIKKPTLTPLHTHFHLDWQEIVLFTLIAFKIGFVFFSALIKPIIDVDAIQSFSIVAKILFHNHTILSPHTIANFCGTKPVLPFLAQGWAALCMQIDNDIWVKAISPLFWFSLVAIFYCVLRRNCSRKFSLLFTFFLSALPLLTYHATTAYADLLITCYFSFCCLYLFVFMNGFLEKPANVQYGHLALSLTFAALTIWTKNAGIAIISGLLLVLLIFLIVHRRQVPKQAWGKIGIAFLLLLVLAIPLMAPRLNFIRGTISGLAGHNDANVLAIAKIKNVEDVSLLSKTSSIAQILFNKMFFYGDWQLTWSLLLAALIFFPGRSFAGPSRYLLGILGLSVLSVFVQFESTSTFIWLADGTLLDRLLMNEVPLALFVSAQGVIPGLAALNAWAGTSEEKKSGRNKPNKRSR